MFLAWIWRRNRPDDIPWRYLKCYRPKRNRPADVSPTDNPKNEALSLNRWDPSSTFAPSGHGIEPANRGANDEEYIFGPRLVQIKGSRGVAAPPKSNLKGNSGIQSPKPFAMNPTTSTLRSHETRACGFSCTRPATPQQNTRPYISNPSAHAALQKRLDETYCNIRKPGPSRMPIRRSITGTYSPSRPHFSHALEDLQDETNRAIFELDIVHVQEKAKIHQRPSGAERACLAERRVSDMTVFKTHPGSRMSSI